MPTATRSDRQKRVPDRQDFTRKVETEYDHIIRHGDSPEDYSWEVRDKMGNIFWYGMYPDSGGPLGDPGDWDGPLTNDESIARSAILADDAGNGFTWYLKAQRDVGVNTIRYEYDTVYYKAGENDDGVTWTKVADAGRVRRGLRTPRLPVEDLLHRRSPGGRRRRGPRRPGARAGGRWRTRSASSAARTVRTPSSVRAADSWTSTGSC